MSVAALGFMTFPMSAGVFALVVFASACGPRQEEAPQAKDVPVLAKEQPGLLKEPPSLMSADNSVVTDFEQRVRDFVKLRDAAEDRVGRIPAGATPEQIVQRQRALGAEIAKHRAGAGPGAIFVPGMQTYIRNVVRRVINGADGPVIKASLMDENPMAARVAINERYPDTVPMSTMPPDVLAALPTLPADLEYRFVGNRLILLDIRSHFVIDVVENTFPI
jgi:hypothetical protein